MKHPPPFFSVKIKINNTRFDDFWSLLWSPLNKGWSHFSLPFTIAPPPSHSSQASKQAIQCLQEWVLRWSALLFRGALFDGDLRGWRFPSWFTVLLLRGWITKLGKRSYCVSGGHQFCLSRRRMAPAWPLPLCADSVRHLSPKEQVSRPCSNRDTFRTLAFCWPTVEFLYTKQFDPRK